MKYIYGPVQSRRLGFSLGLNLVPYKVCSFDCIYCQLGRTTKLTTTRAEYIPVREVLSELRLWLANHQEEFQNLDYITLAGSGDPTLNAKIGELVTEIKKLTKIPLAVITNASLLPDPSVRQALLAADLIVPSLDAVMPNAFAKVNRPHPDLKLEEIIESLVKLRKEFRGKIWLEVMLVKGANDDLRYIKKLQEVAERINPDKIQLNSPVRTPAEQGVCLLEAKKLQKFKEILGEKCEII